MTLLVVSVYERTSIADVARAMLEHDVGCVLVRDPWNRVCGIITETDFTAHERYLPFSSERSLQLLGEPVSWQTIEDAYARGRGLTAGQVMRSPVITVSAETTVGEAAGLMHRHAIGRLPVLCDGEVLGILTRHDLLKLVAYPRSTGGRATPEPRDR